MHLYDKEKKGKERKQKHKNKALPLHENQDARQQIVILSSKFG